MPRSLLAAVVGLLVAAAPAAAQSSATATPASPGKPTMLHFDIDTGAAPFNGRLPLGFALAAPGGMTFNPKAAPKTCNPRRHTLGDCSPDSLIGKGSMMVTTTATSFGNTQIYHDTLPVNLFRGDDNQIVAFTMIEGQPKMAPGTMNTASGLSFNLLLPLVKEYRNVNMTLDRLVLDLGASRIDKVKVSKKVRRHGKVRTKVRHKTVHRNLLSLPKACGPNGVWNSVATMTFDDRSMQTVVMPIACAPAPAAKG